jgi:hypothetical protein
MSEHPSAFSEFSRTIWAKVLGVLTIIMMVLGIYVEFITSWRGTSEGIASQAIAREAALRQEAERREKQAVAELNAIKAQNATQRERGEAQKSGGEGAVQIARTPYADKLAEQELRQRTAEADQKEAEAERARAETVRAKAETQRARVAAAKDLVDCKQKGFILNAMTGENCNEPDSNGNPPDNTEQLARMGFVARAPRDVDVSGNKYVPVGEAEGQAGVWTRYVKDRSGYAAFAVAANGVKYGATWDMQTEEAASNGALASCTRKGGAVCRVIITHLNQRTRAGSNATPATPDTNAGQRYWNASSNTYSNALGLAANGVYPKQEAATAGTVPATGETKSPAEFQPSPYCVERLKAWNAAKAHSAFAVSKLGGCAWTAERPTQGEAVSYVMDQCAKNQRTCKILAAK